MTEYIFKCKNCGEEFVKEFDNIDEAIKHHGNHTSNGCGGEVSYDRQKESIKYNELKLDKIKREICKGCKLGADDCPQSPEMLSICQFESYEYRLRTGRYNVSGAISGASPVDSIASIPEPFNKQKLDKISKSTCKSCKLTDECSKSPAMLVLCEIESLEYRLRTGKYGLSSGTGAVEFSKDIKDVIVNIDGTLVSIEDIKRLFIARWDTYSLYPKNYTGEEAVPETESPPTDDVILRALMGDITIGFRPVDPETGLYKWIAYDIDKKASNPRQAVDEIVKHLKEWYNLTGYIELSGSPDSYHVWIFIEPTDKEIVYKFDDSFKARCEPRINKAICCRVQRGEKESGRMIKMPYAINLENGKRGKFIEWIDLHKIQPEKLPVIEALK